MSEYQEWENRFYERFGSEYVRAYNRRELYSGKSKYFYVSALGFDNLNSLANGFTSMVRVKNPCFLITWLDPLEAARFFRNWAGDIYVAEYREAFVRATDVMFSATNAQLLEINILNHDLPSDIRFDGIWSNTLFQSYDEKELAVVAKKIRNQCVEGAVWATVYKIIPDEGLVEFAKRFPQSGMEIVDADRGDIWINDSNFSKQVALMPLEKKGYLKPQELAGKRRFHLHCPENVNGIMDDSGFKLEKMISYIGGKLVPTCACYYKAV